MDLTLTFIIFYGFLISNEDKIPDKFGNSKHKHTPNLINVQIVKIKFISGKVVCLLYNDN